MVGSDGIGCFCRVLRLAGCSAARAVADPAADFTYSRHFALAYFSACRQRTYYFCPAALCNGKRWDRLEAVDGLGSQRQRAVAIRAETLVRQGAVPMPALNPDRRKKLPRSCRRAQTENGSSSMIGRASDGASTLRLWNRRSCAAVRCQCYLPRPRRFCRQQATAFLLTIRSLLRPASTLAHTLPWTRDATDVRLRRRLQRWTLPSKSSTSAATSVRMERTLKATTVVRQPIEGVE